MRCNECGSEGAVILPEMDRPECRACAVGRIEYLIANAIDVETDPTPSELRAEIVRAFEVGS
jgi:hypothetical protein